MAKNGKKDKKPVVSHGWYYMATKEGGLSVSDLKAVLESEHIEVEIWPEAGVLEAVLGEKASMDIEECDLDMGDEFSNNYLANIGATALFYISFKSEIAEACHKLLKAIVRELGGQICGDTEDFTPVIK